MFENNEEAVVADAVETAPPQNIQPNKSKKTNVQRIVRLCVILAVIAVLAIGYGIYAHVSSAQRYSALATGAKGVVVATSDVKVGDAFTAQNVAVKEIPTGAVPSDAVTSTSDIIGSYSVANASAGTVITNGNVTGDKSATLTGRIGEDNVAISISVNQQTGAAGLVHQGDHVTLYGTISSGDGGASMLAKGVKVLALDSNLDGHKSDYSTITVEVTEDAAKAIARAQSAGSITCVVEPASEN